MSVKTTAAAVLFDAPSGSLPTNRWSEQFESGATDKKGRAIGCTATHQDICLSTQWWVDESKRRGLKDAELGQTVTECWAQPTRDGIAFGSMARSFHFAEKAKAKEFCISKAQAICAKAK